MSKFVDNIYNKYLKEEWTKKFQCAGVYSISVNNKIVYEIVHKKFNKLFSVKSIDCHMEVTSVNYGNISNKRIEIQEKPFNVTTLKVDNTTEKLRFVSEGIGKKVKILC